MRRNALDGQAPLWFSNAMTDDPKRKRAPGSEHLREVGVCRALLRAMGEPESPWPEASEPALNRSDLDWNHLTEYLTACGLARPLLGRLKNHETPSWMPSSFLAQLHARASNDAIADLIKREALDQVVCVLRKLGARGVLLKGSALMVLRGGPMALPAQRATGDIDLYIEPAFAHIVRLQLLAGGFHGAADEPRSAAHHLAPVVFRGMAVEIHERIMPSFWGLPENEMLACTLAVDGHAPLCTLSPEGVLLHAGVHASAPLFASGLKTAWDLLWILNRFPDLDWDKVARWVTALGLPRAFWVPVRVLAEELSLPLSAEFMRNAPLDRREAKLESLARARLFSALEGPFDLNPFTKTGVFLLLHDSWKDRIRYLTSLRDEKAAEARNASQQHHPMQTLSQVSGQLSEAFLEWRRYRRSLARLPGRG
jgi:hypothetical protein